MKTSNEIIKLNDNERQRRVYGVDGIAPHNYLMQYKFGEDIIRKK